jgi:hypothetical protein
MRGYSGTNRRIVTNSVSSRLQFFCFECFFEKLASLRKNALHAGIRVRSVCGVQFSLAQIGPTVEQQLHSVVLSVQCRPVRAVAPLNWQFTGLPLTISSRITSMLLCCVANETNESSAFWESILEERERLVAADVVSQKDCRRCLARGPTAR